MWAIKKILYKLIGKQSNYIVAPISIIDDIIVLCNGKANIVFDVGAHHGRYSTEIEKKISINTIYCFEPFPPSFDILAKNLNQSWYSIHKMALSDFDGVSTFYVNEFEETNSLLESSETHSQIDQLLANKGVIQVQVQKLDSFCSFNGIQKIDILKIDTQGNTLNVLRGAETFLKKKFIGVIQCEVEFLEIYKGESLFHVIAYYLEQFNYSLYSLYNIHYDVNNRISWADALFYQDVKKN